MIPHTPRTEAIEGTVSMTADIAAVDDVDGAAVSRKRQSVLTGLARGAGCVGRIPADIVDGHLIPLPRPTTVERDRARGTARRAVVPECERDVAAAKHAAWSDALPLTFEGTLLRGPCSAMAARRLWRRLLIGDFGAAVPCGSLRDWRAGRTSPGRAHRGRRPGRVAPRNPSRDQVLGDHHAEPHADDADSDVGVLAAHQCCPICRVSHEIRVCGPG